MVDGLCVLRMVPVLPAADCLLCLTVTRATHSYMAIEAAMSCLVLTEWSFVLLMLGVEEVYVSDLPSRPLVSDICLSRGAASRLQR